MVVPRTTGYAPALGGINGSCRGGASKHRGFPACVNTLQAYNDNLSPFIHVATQQHGGTAALFGCWANAGASFSMRGVRTPAGKSCHMMAMVDHYARSEDEGRIGVNGKVTGVKMDVEVSKLDYQYKALGRIYGGQVTCVRRAFGVQNKDKPTPRRIRRRRSS